MKSTFPILGFIALLAFIVLYAWKTWSTTRSADSHSETVSVREVPELISELKDRGKNGSFVVFMFDTSNGSCNVQYSIENDRLGFDWVLLAPENVKAENRVDHWIKAAGYPVTKRTMNGVTYLRSEGEGIKKLGPKALVELYELPGETRLEVIREGF